MKKKNRLWCLITLGIAAGFCALTSLCSSANVYAEDGRPDYRMDIYPGQVDLNVMNPGGSYSGKFTLENSGKQDFDYEVSFAPYTVTNENYDPNYDTENQYTDIAKWISVDKKSGSVASGEKTDISYIVKVPVDAHGGAQSGVIMITMLPGQKNEENNAVQAVHRLGYLVFGNVDGEITKTGKVLENKVPSFLFNPPIIGTSVVENTGNVYTAAKYSLQVFPLFSDEEVYTNEEDPESNIVFPETKRYNEIRWDGAPHLGIFRVRQTVKIFDEESVTEKIVFLCPLWFLFIVLLLIFCIIFWLVSRVIRRKREA